MDAIWSYDGNGDRLDVNDNSSPESSREGSEKSCSEFSCERFLILPARAGSLYNLIRWIPIGRERVGNVPDRTQTILFEFLIHSWTLENDGTWNLYHRTELKSASEEGRSRHLVDTCLRRNCGIRWRILHGPALTRVFNLTLR